jgi:translocator protein
LGTIGFNWLAAVGSINGITPEKISNAYPTPITPAGYAFAIWSLIYFGLIAFSVYQMLPSNLERFRNVRSHYILSCALNCAWIYFWHNGQISICLGIIIALCVTLFFINYQLRSADSVVGNLISKGTFGIYFGWVTAATLVNFAVLLVYLKVSLSESVNTWLAVGLILLAAALGVLIRVLYKNYFYPLAIAWALTAIAVKQSGNTLPVTAAAIGVVACLIAAISFVLTLNSSTSEQR